MKKNILLFLMVFSASLMLAQDRIIKGVVTSKEDKQPLIGATIIVKGTTIGTVTDIDGQYSINVPQKYDILLFTCVGMKPLERKIDGGTEINVVLEEMNIALNEVVVSALGIKREAKSLAYSRQGVNAEDLSENKSTDFVNSLAGKIAGLQITSGATNTSSSQIVIRGNSSITGNNSPLFVVDGVPMDTDNNNQSAILGGGLDYGGGGAHINPDDIEQIEVLKGPNAAALYGSRAANGVILINTKKASGASRFKVSVSSNTQIQYVNQYPEYQNKYGGGNAFMLDNMGAVSDNSEVLRIANLDKHYRSWGAPMFGQQVYNLDRSLTNYDAQPDNFKNVYHTAVQTTNTLTLEGGDKTNNYRFSITSMYSNSPVERMNIINRQSVNARLYNTLTKNLILDTRVTYVNELVKNRQYINGNDKNPAYQYIYMMRNLKKSDFENYKDENGNELGTHRDFMNPIWAINENHNADTRNRINAVFNLDYTFNKYLKSTIKFGPELLFMDGYEFANMGAVSDLNGMMMNINNKTTNYTLDGLLLYNRIWENISVNANVGLSQFHSVLQMASQRTNALLMPDWDNIANTAENVIATNVKNKKRINSVFASANIGVRQFLYLDVTARNDWSSTLPVNNNSYFYPSMGASLIFTELFEISRRIMPYAKLRGSYAIVGNDTQPYRLLNYFNVSGIFNDFPMASQETLFAEKNLKPEQTNSYEVGADLRFWGNRISFDFTYYNSNTKNQILTAQLSSASGYQSRMYNAGEVKNSGIEISIGATPIRRSNFNWTLTLNFAKNKSEVVSLVDGVNSFKLQEWTSVAVFAEVGQPFGVIRGVGFKYDENGRRLVDSEGKYLFAENSIIGNANPDWTGSFNNVFKYKQLDFSFLIDIKKGGSIFSASRKKGSVAGIWKSTLKGRDDFYLENIIYGRNPSALELNGGILCEGYLVDGRPNNIYISPQIYFQTGGPGRIDAMNVYDASFVKLRQVSVGWTVPGRLIKKTPFKHIRLAAVGRNLWTIHQNTPNGLDPESSVNIGNGKGIEIGSLPPMANVGVDIRVAF